VISVMLVEDDPEFLGRFATIIAGAPDLSLFSAVSDGASARRALECRAPDVLLVDIGLPDMSGIDIVREVRGRHPQTDVMVVTVFGDEEHVVASIEAGATGYLLKDSLPQEIVGAIRELRAGGSPITPIIARRLLDRFRSPPSPSPSLPDEFNALSPRESEALSYIAKGFTFSEIAGFMNVSTHTVTAHVKKIYQKLEVHSGGEAVYEATRMGLLK
jgi:DNA-binding NarL/FixJ family response regulator